MKPKPKQRKKKVKAVKAWAVVHKFYEEVWPACLFETRRNATILESHQSGDQAMLTDKCEQMKYG